MKKTVLISAALALPFFSLFSQEDRWRGISFFNPRSQGDNGVRNVVARHPFIHKPDTCNCYSTLHTSFEYHRSTRPDRTANVLFGTDKLTISGSQVSRRGPNDLLADYFGLATKFHSDIDIDPSIQWLATNFALYCGLDGFVQGLYVDVHVPVVWTKWGLQLTESIHPESENNDYPNGYMGIGGATAASGATSFITALAGGVTWGEMKDPIKFGKIPTQQQTKHGVADVHLRFGWDFCTTAHGYAGINLQLVVPTGTRPDSEILFEPIVGNGKHWQVGAGFASRTLVWEEGGVQELSVFTDVSFTHFLKARQRRSFDLKKVGACPGEQGEINYGSRYMLFKDFSKPGVDVQPLTPVINHTTLCCDVSISFQMDAVLMFGYTYDCFIFDIGYNGWIRSKERICLKEKGFAANIFALKGIQDATGDDTQHLAMISEETIINGSATFTAMPPEFPESHQDRLADDDPPVFTPSSLIDERSAASHMMLTHKFFAHVGWSVCLPNNIECRPSIGLGAEVEFEGFNERDTAQLNKNTLNQWGIWMYATVPF